MTDAHEPTACEIYLREIANNPRFVAAKRYGEAIEILGARPLPRKERSDETKDVDER
jgi:hypothetical protein